MKCDKQSLGPACSEDNVHDCSRIGGVSVNVLRADDDHFRKGKACYDNGRLDDAIAEFRLAIASDPDNAEARLLLGDIYERQGMYDEAIGEYEEVIRLNPDDRLLLFKYETARRQKERSRK